METRYLRTVESVAQAVREGRDSRGWTQNQLAERAGVGRRFIVSLEAGHERAELAKVLQVLDVLDIHAAVLPPAVKRTKMSDVDLDKVIDEFR
ncbi:type II toxin-antitoxin system Y4mF family antitoxin [Jonesia quinghaiensis]|uniref:type II toxin-antitoxin system Y4mF family antitoxin n=1 Tax=Jonesia quinghaiensis TaxID=262806 RepID=UPI00041659A0|nr:type II toxin-antitoxin system Y4mF family antitoxin [Jonesia quinghaiensis]